MPSSEWGRRSPLTTARTLLRRNVAELERADDDRRCAHDAAGGVQALREVQLCRVEADALGVVRAEGHDGRAGPINQEPDLGAVDAGVDVEVAVAVGADADGAVLGGHCRVGDDLPAQPVDEVRELEAVAVADRQNAGEREPDGGVAQPAEEPAGRGFSRGRRELGRRPLPVPSGFRAEAAPGSAPGCHARSIRPILDRCRRNPSLRIVFMPLLYTDLVCRSRLYQL